MSIMALIASFGGGVLGAYMGALPAFIMTGVFAIIGSIATMAGAPGELTVGIMAFGSFLGPHIAFAGGVAAAAYAGKKKKMENGAAIAVSLYGLGSADVLAVGGVFGVIGFVIAYLVNLTPVGPLTDLPGIVVIISAIIARFAFGTSGLTGKRDKSDPYITPGAGMANNFVWALGVGVAVSFIAAVLYETVGSDAEKWSLVGANYPLICFGFSAVTLIFAQTGSATPGSHHVTLPSALAAVVGINAFGVGGAMLGVVFAVICGLFGDFIACTFNTKVDTHIDPPAATIFIFTIVISLIRIALLGA